MCNTNYLQFSVYSKLVSRAYIIFLITILRRNYDRNTNTVSALQKLNAKMNIYLLACSPFYSIWNI